MPAISREPTGLPRTPGNPGKPWRNDRQRKVDDRREEGDRWVENSDEKGETNNTHKRKWT